MFEKKYLEQVNILLNILPLINQYKEFAVKGGTAINFFIFSMPRLSIDIDLCYLPLQPREESFDKMNRLMVSLGKDIEKRFSGYKTRLSRSKHANVYKLFVAGKQSSIKIEPNELLRGSIKKTLSLNVNKAVSGMFNLYPEAQILALPDLFGGKICAALDRQHPRDFFDILMMFRNNLFSEEVRKVFLIYLIQSNRPIAELLEPNRIDFKKTYENEFIGMVRESISIDQLYEVREQLINEIRNGIKPAEKEFLLSVKRGEPQWEKLGIGDFSHLPGTKWKLLNINKMTDKKRRETYSRLETIFQES
jgi:predicted nucleotidyltransferase component of viral defense system